MAKKLLITIHGINSRGAWQEEVVGALGKHFACEVIKYDGYHFLGFLRNCVCLRCIILLSAVAYVCSYWSKMAALAVMLAAVLLSFLLACNKRARLLRKTVKRYDEASEKHSDPSPHVIAHSFGTYLICAALKKHAGAMAFDRAVLFGSVVHDGYPWVEIVRKGAIRAVRNETGSQDRVVRLARLAFWIRDMGDSGFKGFSALAPGVENAPFSFEHSDAVALRKHILEPWLPFFWAIPPQDYQYLLRHSANCLREVRPGSFGSPGAFPDFDHSVWSWTWLEDPGKCVSFRAFMDWHLEDFCRCYGISWLVGTPYFANAYALARWVFWELCGGHDNHPRVNALKAAELALEPFR